MVAICCRNSVRICMRRIRMRAMILRIQPPLFAWFVSAAGLVRFRVLVLTTISIPKSVTSSVIKSLPRNVPSLQQRVE